MKSKFLTLSIIGFLLSITAVVYFFKNISPKRAESFWQNIIDEVFTLKIKKKVIVDYYGVDKTTFRKWIKYFGKEVFPDFEAYKKKRKLTLAEYISVLAILGMKEKHQILSKKEIVELGEGNYRSLRESVYHYPEHFGITIEQFANLRIFPPLISMKILHHYSSN